MNQPRRGRPSSERPLAHVSSRSHEGPSERDARGGASTRGRATGTPASERGSDWARCSHARRRRFSGHEPSLDFRYVAFRVSCESFETSGSAERVLALWSLDGEAPLALLGDVHNHVADRVEHLSLVRHRTKIAESDVLPQSG